MKANSWGLWAQALFPLLALCVAAVPAGAAAVTEVEPNDSIATAQTLDTASFDLSFDANVGDASYNTSQGIPHVTVLGTGDGTLDYYAVTVAAGDRGIFDVDFGTDNGIESHLSLYDSGGLLLATNDDAPVEYGQGGSTSGLDSFLDYTFEEAGVYVVEVGECCFSSPVPTGGAYELQVSIGRQTAVLLRDRFLASVRWNGNPADVSPLRTDESGIFYFYGANNLEVVVKVLNGCGRNGHYWVFAAGATGVDFTVRAEDTLTGEVWTSSGANPITDTSAFATCP